MPNRDDLEQRIRALSDDEAIRALAELMEERGLLPAADQLPSTEAELAASVTVVDAEAYLRPDQPTPSDGQLARSALEYAAAQREDLVETVSEAVDYARSPADHPESFTLPVAVLVITLLQTEVILKRSSGGRWSLTIHKRALRDSALGRVLTELISRITGGR
ncbi:hypothetical protein PZB75_11670 [Streptomyces sp. AM 4-1-1]|uniref:hypothetical protein n=1 Tax=Streptomyces sp. AM 4-1-1 TaxID=3028710 RepID=UPI0023B940AD|nr:hypothetical protein [Streptomyces sp. AM 4-1-1]WEH33970.1 hypothetical protein PZB75_11670 [Streptomyces sp. AM 4-1-1]